METEEFYRAAGIALAFVLVISTFLITNQIINN